MAKRENAKPSADRPAVEAGGASDQGPAQSLGIHSAADAVRRAEAELKKARQFYDNARRQAADRLKAARETTLGDLIDGTLESVKKHPGRGVITAGVIGFFLGRLFRR